MGGEGNHAFPAGPPPGGGSAPICWNISSGFSLIPVFGEQAVLGSPDVDGAHHASLRLTTRNVTATGSDLPGISILALSSQRTGPDGCATPGCMQLECP
jgi:hypothetical protein